MAKIKVACFFLGHDVYRKKYNFSFFFSFFSAYYDHTIPGCIAATGESTGIGNLNGLIIISLFKLLKLFYCSSDRTLLHVDYDVFAVCQ